MTTRSHLAERLAGITLGAATITMGLIAGVYYAFSCSVMLGLSQTDDRTFVEVMQRINVVIVNPVFAVSFFGTLILSVIAVVLQRRLGPRAATRWIVAAAVLYVASLVVTMGANIPLNDQLVRAGDPNHIVDIARVRKQFEVPWGAWNIVRGVMATVALGCLGRALVLHGRASAGEDRTSR